MHGGFHGMGVPYGARGSLHKLWLHSMGLRVPPHRVYGMGSFGEGPHMMANQFSGMHSLTVVLCTVLASFSLPGFCCVHRTPSHFSSSFL